MDHWWGRTAFVQQRTAGVMKVGLNADQCRKTEASVSCSSPPRARSSWWHEYEVFIIMSKLLKISNDSFSKPNSKFSQQLGVEHFRARWSDGGRFQELRTAWSLTSRSKSSRARTKVDFVPLRNVLVPPRDDDDGTNVLETNCKKEQSDWTLTCVGRRRNRLTMVCRLLFVWFCTECKKNKHRRVSSRWRTPCPPHCRMTVYHISWWWHFTDAWSQCTL